MPRRTIYFAKITRDPQRRVFDQDFRTDILEAIDPELVEERYGRIWRFSRPVEVAETLVAGKLGFTHEGEQQQAEYDEVRQDFVTVQAPARQTVFSHFVIATDLEVMAFEDRGREIRRQSFLGAFQGLLHEGDFLASVEELTDPASLADWVASVDRVVRLKAVVHNPNPGWVRPAGAVRALVEQSGAETADVTVTASPDGALDTGAEWIDEVLDQVSTEGQGKMAAVGYRGEHESRWTTGQRVRTETLEEDPGDDSLSIWRRIAGKLREVL